MSVAGCARVVGSAPSMHWNVWPGAVSRGSTANMSSTNACMDDGAHVVPLRRRSLNLDIAYSEDWEKNIVRCFLGDHQAMNKVHTSQLNASLGWAFLRLGDLSADQGRLLNKHHYIKTKDQLTLFLGFALMRHPGCIWRSVMKK